MQLNESVAIRIKYKGIKVKIRFGFGVYFDVSCSFRKADAKKRGAPVHIKMKKVCNDRPLVVGEWWWLVAGRDSRP